MAENMAESKLFSLVVVGSGPAGLSAAGHAQANGLETLLLERADHLSDTIFRYQKGKPVMGEPSPVPLRSPLPFAPGEPGAGAASREQILAAWDDFHRTQGLDVRFGCELLGLSGPGLSRPGLSGPGLSGLGGAGSGDGHFRLDTSQGPVLASNVVLAIGTQGTPRQLGAPGENLPHVDPYLEDPDAYRDADIVVVGAGDSALEVALALYRRNRVTLVVRRSEITRAAESLERAVLSAHAGKELNILFDCTVRSVSAESVELDCPEGVVTVRAQRVIPRLGTLPPRKLLESFGITFSGERRDARPVLSHVYESSVPGLFLIGAVSGRDLIKLGMNQGYEVVEHLLGRDVLPADEDLLRERLPLWSGTVRARIEDLQGEIPLLAAADEGSLREVMLSAWLHTYGEGDVILRQLDYTDSFQILCRGAVDIYSFSEQEQQERHLATLEAGNFFGEMGLLSGRRRNATAIARGDTRVLEIPRKAMLGLLAAEPAVKRQVDQAFLLRAFQDYLFPNLAQPLLWELVHLAESRHLPAGRELFHEGDLGDAYYLIRSGKVKISKLSGEREVVLTYLVSGNHFGETALLPDARRTATVTTIFPSELIVLTQAKFEAFLARHPELRSDLLNQLEARRDSGLAAMAEPGAGAVLTDLIDAEIVMGTDVLIIDEHRCVRCNNCIHACEGVHADGQARLSLTGIKLYNLLAPNSCWQCEDPQCMLDCPPDAIARHPRGEVYIKNTCIGCGNCERNCPYDNIFMVYKKPKQTLLQWLRAIFVEGDGTSATDQQTLKQQVAVKCDLCADLPGGPACVRSCPTAAAVRLSSEEYQQRLEDMMIQVGAGPSRLGGA